MSITSKTSNLDDLNIVVIGLGYVGLPLAVEFGKKFKTLGFDLNANRINELKSGQDSTLEVSAEEMADAKQLNFTGRAEDIRAANFYIVTVPTPVDENNTPDLSPLRAVSKTLGDVISKGDIVVFESTVYPGTTEEVCVPIIEAVSGFKFNQDFFAGYSPERINPGDKERRIHSIIKVTSGSTPEVADFIDSVYRQIIIAGTHKASSIKVAEAAKVIENTQRDLNIALVNELAIIFNALGIDTEEVLKAAGTKWNFLPFRPGLVGGHCIGVDPYYLAYKAESVGYHPDVILAGRRINNGMGSYVASQLIKAMVKKGIKIPGSKVLIMGLTFKEDCPDVRNTRVVDIIKELEEYGVEVDVYDPWVKKLDGISVSLIESPVGGKYDGIMLAVAHELFRSLGADAICSYAKDLRVVYDLKCILPAGQSDLRL